MNTDDDNLLEQLQTPVVRDLAWACFSTPLLRSEELAEQEQNVSNCGLGLTEQRLHWLEALDQAPAPLLDHLGSARENRLGLYFERLWHFFLEQDEQTELLAHNLAVREGGRTIGEFDCIYFCRQRQRNFHLELAVKFYLGHPLACLPGRHSHWNQWLGANTRDRLDLKVEHLMQHQIRLADHPAAGELLEALGVDTVEREVEIKGRLFHPGNGILPVPFACTAAMALHKWWRINELATRQWTGHTRFLPLDKMHWFAEITIGKDQPVMDREELLQWLAGELASTGRAQLVAVIDNDGVEVERFFVTRQEWPDND